MKSNTADGRSDNVVHNDQDGAFERINVEFPSCGVLLRGMLLLPAALEGKLPAIVMAPGMSGVKEGSIFRYAEFFARGGFAVLAYDNINFGDSQGEPRQEADPLLQRRGYRDAITFVSLRPEVDRTRIGVWGTSYSGGHVLEVAAHDRRVKCVVSQIGFASGFQNFRRRVLPLQQAARRASWAASLQPSRRFRTIPTSRAPWEGRPPTNTSWTRAGRPRTGRTSSPCARST